MSITVTSVNDAPVCQDLALTTAKNVAVGGDGVVLRTSRATR